ncbi:MAG: hypothetical protein WC386_00970 [Candidatus Paceibacterota bacterium]|jgi:type IV secretory pathway TrbL component
MATNQPKPFEGFENAFYRCAILIAVGLVIVWFFLSVLEAMAKTFSSMAVGIGIGIMVGAVLMHFYHVKKVTP